MSVTVSLDLRSQFGPVRDQGERPTCLAFAASDAHAARRGSWDELSCEYLFYHAQRRAGRAPHQGAFLRDMLDALREDGQPREDGWPYLSQVPADQSQYCPPSQVGPLFGRDGSRSREDVNLICQRLDKGEAAIVLMVLTRTFFQPPPDHVIDDLEGDAVFPVPRHAVVAVGHGQSALGRALLIRNSWGSTWGDGGHAWVTEAFVTRHMYDLALLTDEADVSRRSAAA